MDFYFTNLQFTFMDAVFHLAYESFIGYCHTAVF